jgi:hypothetical protein
MGEEGSSASVCASMVILILAAALGIILTHGLNRPGGGLQQEEPDWLKSLQHRLKERPEFAGLLVQSNRYDVTLSGWVNAVAERRAAVQLVKDSLPAGRSRFREEVGLWTPAWLVVEKKGGQVSMRGELPERNPNEVSGLRKLRGTATPGNDWMWFRRSVAEPLWIKNLADVLDLFLNRVSEGTLEARGAVVTLRGTFVRVSGRNEVLALAKKVWPAGGQGGLHVVDRTKELAGPDTRGKVAIVNQLKLPPQPVAAKPLWLEIGHSGKEFQVRGVVADGVQREELMRALQSGGDQITDGVVAEGEAVASPRWWPALVALIGLFARESEEGSVLVAGEMVEINGRMKAAAQREIFMQAAQQLRQGLPEFELKLAWPGAETPAVPLADHTPKDG